MAWFQRDKKRQRFYLLPGMGGKALRRKHIRILKWSLTVGVLVSGLLALALYWMAKR